MPRALLQSDPPTLPMALSWPAQESVYEPDNKTFKLTKPTHASTSSPSRSSHSSAGFFVACTRSLTTIICRHQPMPRQLLQRDHRDPHSSDGAFVACTRMHNNTFADTNPYTYLDIVSTGIIRPAQQSTNLRLTALQLYIPIPAWASSCSSHQSHGFQAYKSMNLQKDSCKCKPQPTPDDVLQSGDPPIHPMASKPRIYLKE